MKYHVGDMMIQADGTTVVVTSTDGDGQVIMTSPPSNNGPFGGHYTMSSSLTLKDFLEDLTKPLSKEEQERLEELKKEHEVAIKTAKLDVFKKAPAEMRQFVINALTWNETHNSIEAVSVPKTKEHSDLESRHNYGRLFMSHGSGFSINPQWSTSAGGSVFDFLRSIGLPNGITVVDLQQAHLEATMEEEMLNGGQTEP